MQRWSLPARMKHHRIPGVAVAVIKNGEVVLTNGYGVLQSPSRQSVDKDTAFSVGSVSKVATATAILALSEKEKIDIDADIQTYLKSWSVPPSEFRTKPITLRMLLSHTSGLSVHGFEDYLPNEALPSALEVLRGHPPAKNEPVTLAFAPGSARQYSGGGVTVAQVLLTDALGAPFADIVADTLFVPLKMSRSTFESPLPADHGNIAKAHDENGSPAALPRGWESMPEQAASGLWSSAEDLATLVTALIESHRTTTGLLSRTVARDMMTEVEPSYNGLGPRMDRADGSVSFNHPGANDSYRAWIEGNLETGDGLVVLTNGTNGFALIIEIRNAVSDTFGWANNRPIRLAASVFSDGLLAALKGRHISFASYPTALRKELYRLRAGSDLTATADGDTLTVAGSEGSLVFEVR